MKTIVDINCDMGEGMPHDAELMPFISSANIACGAHAGNLQTIERTIELCLQHNVAIGAHPSFYDIQNFGRTEMQVSDTALYQLIASQLAIFATVVQRMGAKIHHIKPHGALYNMASRNPAMAAVVANVIVDFDKNITLYGLAGSCLIAAGKKAGLKTLSEVFADRTYQPDGALTPRSQHNALIHAEETALSQALQMVLQQSVTAVNGTIIPLTAETICIHGDGGNAVAFAKKIFNTFNEKNISVGVI